MDDTASWGAVTEGNGTGLLRQQIGETLATVRYISEDIRLLKAKVDIASIDLMKMSQRLEAVERLRQPVEEMIGRYKQMLWFSRLLSAVATGALLIAGKIFGPWILHWFGINR